MNFKIMKSKNLIKLIISILILLSLVEFINFQTLFNSLRNANYLFLIALAIIPFSILLRAYRWMVIINKEKNFVTLKDSYNLTLVGIALNIFLPASSGDVAKSYYGYKWHGLKEEMLSSSIVDKIIALLSIFMIGSISAIFLKMHFLSLFSIICASILLLVIFYPQIAPWHILNKLFYFFTKKKLNEENLQNSFTISNKIKLFTLLISTFAWIISYLQFFILCKSFYIDINFIYILAVASLINLSLLFPFTLNGIGSGEVMMVYLFSIINISPTLAIVISLLYSQVLTTIIPGLFGLIIIVKK